jgi:hypothetical protein
MMLAAMLEGDQNKMNKPAYKHNCTTCIYLGTFYVGKSNGCRKIADLYVCKKQTETTVIARYSNNTEDYRSGLSVPAVDLLYATVLAVRAGHLTPQDLVDNFRDLPDNFEY